MYNRNYPKCPWCEFQEKDYYEYGFKGEDSVVEIECPKCENSYKATMYVAYSFETVAIGCKLHELVPTYIYSSEDSKPYNYVCRLCSNSFLPGELSKLKAEEFDIYIRGVKQSEIK